MDRRINVLYDGLTNGFTSKPTKDQPRERMTDRVSDGPTNGLPEAPSNQQDHIQNCFSHPIIETFKPGINNNIILY